VNAELLSKFTLGCDRAYLDARPEGELSCEEGEGYDRALGERSRGIPAVYITLQATTNSGAWILSSTPAVLIPRPETEHVVETVSN